MDDALRRDPVLAKFRAALQQIYGERLERAVLFGSRARGEARPDSDYDIAVFLKSLPDRWAELDRLADLRVRFIDETGAFFDARPYPAGSYRDQTPLMTEIRREGGRCDAAGGTLSGKGAVVSTDELIRHGLLKGDGYQHGQVKHGEGDYAHHDYRLDATIHTNTVESFWPLFKKSVASTHIHISAKHMQRYLDEFTFRKNHRQMVNGMFDLLIWAV